MLLFSRQCFEWRTTIIIYYIVEVAQRVVTQFSEWMALKDKQHKCESVKMCSVWKNQVLGNDSLTCVPFLYEMCLHNLNIIFSVCVPQSKSKLLQYASMRHLSFQAGYLKISLHNVSSIACLLVSILNLFPGQPVELANFIINEEICFGFKRMFKRYKMDMIHHITAFSTPLPSI